MSEELLLSPEVMMHEEPGHITLDQEEVSMELDDDEIEHLQSGAHFPFANGDIPSELTITKVTGTAQQPVSRHWEQHQQRPTLKVRNDLMGNRGPVNVQSGGTRPGMARPMHASRPPPLVRKGGVAAGSSGLPPLPRLKFGGGSQRARNGNHPGMMNMQPRSQQHQMFAGNFPHPAAFAFGGHSPNVPPGPYHGNRMGKLPPMFHPQFHPSSANNFMTYPPQFPVQNKSSVIRPPPMMKAGSLGVPNGQKSSVQSQKQQVKTVCVPPPMKMANKAPHHPASNGGNMRSVLKSKAKAASPQVNQQQKLHYEQALAAQQRQMQTEEEEEEIDDTEDVQEDEEATFLDEELDDVEPEIDPETNEIDDVEPPETDVVNEQEELVKKIDKHQVTVSITPRSSVSSQSRPHLEPDSVEIESLTKEGTTSVNESQAASSNVEKPQYMRRPDGKGFIRVSENVARRKKKKKKKKPFKGINYRFDGKSIKKRTAKKVNSVSSSVKDDLPPENGVSENDNVLAYLGIQRKAQGSLELGTEDSVPGSLEEKSATDSASAEGINKQRAKKSFRSENSPGSLSSRASSTTESTDNTLKRRLSLSEVLQNQKKLRPDGVTVRSNFLGRNQGKNQSNGALKGEEFMIDDTGVLEAEECQPVIKSEPIDPSVPDGLVTPLPRLRARKNKALTSPSKRMKIESPTTPLQTYICDCAKPDEELLEAAEKSSSDTYCQAIEWVADHKVGCTNKVENLRYRKHSKNATGRLYCPTHSQRFSVHHACGFCGEFCAHGMFFMCRPLRRSQPHFFHKTCFNKADKNSRKCPHCGSSERPLAVMLKLSMTKVPLSLLQLKSRISFSKNKVKKTDSIKKEAFATHKLPDGAIISVEGLPSGLQNDALEKIIKTLDDKQSLKVTTRNMYIPVKAGDNVKVLQLLSLGYSPNTRFSECENGTPLHVAASEGHTLTAHILVQAGSELDIIDEEQNTPLMLACIKGKAEVVRYLLKAGADPSLKGDDGMTCLHLSAQNGFLECTKVILEHTHLPKNFMNGQDEGGWTPLVWACENKHESVIKFLLSRGANPLITDAEGNIALHWAALSGSRSTCELLLNSGCDVNATNNLGETPMHIALRQDHYECAMLFLMRRARLDIRNKQNLTPAECMISGDVQCKAMVKLSTTLHQLMKDAKTARHERILCNDITRGKEATPIQCVNAFDDEPEPSNYVYISKNCVTSFVPIDRSITRLQHCNCTDTCSSEDTCHCSDLSVKSWYDQRGCLKEGFDFKEPPMIFECNEMCKCNISVCHNRVVQHGITARLQVYRTDGMGWGVKALSDIQKGSFVCEYIGEIISDSEADTREDSYLFDLDNRDGDTFCLDANKFGNIARFINHSCQPNLVPVKVFAEHQDIRFPHIALFASRDIPSGTELGFDYGEKFWVIKHKYFTCHCSYEKCRYNKSNIYNFLKEYYARIGEPLPDDARPPSVQLQHQVSSCSSESIVKKKPAVAESELKELLVPKEEIKETTSVVVKDSQSDPGIDDRESTTSSVEGKTARRSSSSRLRKPRKSETIGENGVETD